jgi:hypothetical protein
VLINKDLPELAVVAIAIDYQLEGLTSPSLTSCTKLCNNAFIETVNLAGIGFITGMIGCSGRPICSGVVIAIYIAGVNMAHDHYYDCVAGC